MIVEEKGVVCGEEGEEVPGDGEFAGAGEGVDVYEWKWGGCGHGAMGWRVRRRGGLGDRLCV